MTLLSEDRELLARFREGKSDALERVYRHYVPAVTRFLRRGFMVSKTNQPMRFALTQPFEIENAVQEVFTRAFDPRARLAYDGLRPYRDFLFGIAKHVALDELRRRTRAGGRATEELDLETLPDESSSETPEERLDTKHAITTVAGFIDKECDDRDRRLYRLRYADDRSQEATAEAEGLTRIQIRRWETKFRQRLLRYLKRVKYV